MGGVYAAPLFSGRWRLPTILTGFEKVRLAGLHLWAWAGLSFSGRASQ